MVGHLPLFNSALEDSARSNSCGPRNEDVHASCHPHDTHTDIALVSRGKSRGCFCSYKWQSKEGSKEGTRTKEETTKSTPKKQKSEEKKETRK